MPVEVTAKYVRIRVANPKQFVRFITKTIGKGIRAIMGFKKGGGSQIQSLLFPKSRYTLASAKAWVKKHGYKVSETFLVTDIIIDPITMELYFEETVVKETDSVDVKKMKKEDLEWLIK